jgi:hypothetical protein
MRVRIYWRLLAFLLLMFVAPRFLWGQAAGADRAPESALAIERVFAPSMIPPRESSPTVPVWIPPPSLPGAYPVAPQRPIFAQFVRAAGIIFSGRVTSVGFSPSSNGQTPASTSVTFQVEHAVRGTSSGQSLTIHEWAGLWSGGERYRVGERVFLFLYSPSKLGLTSPVAGGMGKFAIDSQGRVVMNTQQVATLAADPVLTGKPAGRTGGKSMVLYADFAQAVLRYGGEK